MKNLMITGASGSLGPWLTAACKNHDYHIFALKGPNKEPGIDLTDEASIRRMIGKIKPDIVINLAACSQVNKCFTHPDYAEKLNAQGPPLLTKVLKEIVQKAFIVQVSTDMVFDGTEPPYNENSKPNPLSVYGRTKLRGEKLFLAAGGDLVVRLPLLLGPQHKTVKDSLAPNFFEQMIKLIRTKQPLKLFYDEKRCPISYSVASCALIHLTQKRAQGIYHVPGSESLSRMAIGETLARVMGVDKPALIPVCSAAAACKEPRPKDLTISTLHPQMIERICKVNLFDQIREVL